MIHICGRTSLHLRSFWSVSTTRLDEDLVLTLLTSGTTNSDSDSLSFEISIYFAFLFRARSSLDLSVNRLYRCNEKKLLALLKIKNLILREGGQKTLQRFSSLHPKHFATRHVAPKIYYKCTL